MKNNKLPIKTKITAWLMIIIGTILGLLALVIFIFGIIMHIKKVEDEWIFLFISVGIRIFICGILFFIPGYFLLKKKRWAWRFTLFVLLILIIASLAFLSIASIYGIPLAFLGLISLPLALLLFSDRKNIFNVVSINNKGIIARGKTNWKFFLIIFILAVIIGGVSLIYWYGWLPQEKVKMEKGLLLPKYNLLIIVSDALRADALSCYGGEANTPNICGLAEQGVLFENAYSNASWTLASSLSIFTGNYPVVYIDPEAALDFLKAEKIQTGEPYEINLSLEEMINLSSLYRKINDKELLLAEALKNNGYDTRYKIDFFTSFIDSHNFVNSSDQLQGFEELKGFKDLTEKGNIFIENTTGIKNLGLGYEVIYSVLDYLLNIKEKRFFTLMWIADPHEPYSPPEKFKKNINVELSKLSKNPEFYNSFISQIEQNLPNLTDYDVYYLKQLYLKEVESVDERVGYILKALEYNGLKNNTFIVFTSDHGESFGEHGRMSHGAKVYNEMIHIPLIITGPNIIKGGRVKDSVSHVDLMPTLKDLMEVDCLYNSQGKSYKSLLIGEKDSAKKRVQYVEDYQRALIENNYKLIINHDNTSELYNLSEDPGELNNISKENQVIVDKMKKKMSQLRKEEFIKIIKNLPDVQDKRRIISGLLKWLKSEAIDRF